MFDLNIVRDIVNFFIEENNNYTLFDVKWVNEFGYQILQVLLDKKGGINSDELGIANDYISTHLDKYESELPQNYMLEVSSPGAEKPLRNEEEVLENVGKKIFARTEHEAYEGILLSFEGDELEIKINVKGRIKKIKVKYSSILEIRLSV